METNLVNNLNKLQLPDLVEEKVRDNIFGWKISTNDIIDWCKNIIINENATIQEDESNYYIKLNNYGTVIRKNDYNIIVIKEFK